jgi:hypothetical protein
LSDIELTIQELSRRLQNLEDKDELVALLNSYCSTSDVLDWKAWSQLWTEDASCEAPLGTVRGRDAITENAAQFHVGNEARQHSMTNMQLEIDGDRATGTANLIFFGVTDTDEPGKHWDMGGPYEFEFRRTPDGWRLHWMKLDTIWFLGEPWPSSG